MRIIQNFTLTAVIILLAAGCNKIVVDNDWLSDPPETYDTLVEEGWEFFEGGNIDLAIDAFASAVERDATRPASYLGLGWSYARNQELELAVSNFEDAVTFAENDTASGQQIAMEALAGLAAVTIAAQEYEDAVSYSTQVIEEDVTFAFSHDTSFTIYDLKLLRAEAYFYLGRITEAYTQALNLGISFDAERTRTVSGAGIVDAQTPLTGKCQVVLADVTEGEFTGTGLNDLSTGGDYKGGETVSYKIQIVATGPHDTFKWFLDDIEYEAGVEITGANQLLVDGVRISFEDTTGHAVGDYWEFEAANRALISVSSVKDAISGITYVVLDVDEGTASLSIEGTPPLEEGQIVTVVHTYVDDYGKFINDLLAGLFSLKGSG